MNANAISLSLSLRIDGRRRRLRPLTVTVLSGWRIGKKYPPPPKKKLKTKEKRGRFTLGTEEVPFVVVSLFFSPVLQTAPIVASEKTNAIKQVPKGKSADRR